MSRLPATSAENLANELHRQLELVEFERDEAIRERDEAQAVIDAVRDVRSEWVGVKDAIRHDGIERLDPWSFGLSCGYDDAIRDLNEVDGL